jgi:hypothetical protein
MYKQCEQVKILKLVVDVIKFLERGNEKEERRSRDKR